MKRAMRSHGRKKRHARVRKQAVGSTERPRLSVYRSNRHTYAQLIDDLSGHTLAAASSLTAGAAGDPKSSAKEVGLSVAAQAKEVGVEQVTFDRGGFRYHGRVRAVAEGAREGGLRF
jgi:large subunit ribosomal protein L18